MKACDCIRARIEFYLDDELRGAELAEFEAHVHSCHACQNIVSAERGFLEEIRHAPPLYEAPSDLRARVAKILDDTPAYSSPPELLRRVRQALGRAATATFKLKSRREAFALISAAAFLTVSASIWFATRDGRPPVKPPSRFAAIAVDNHLKHQRGELPFEITSDSPEQISRWFTGRVPFKLELPNYRESTGQERFYRLEGARMIGLEDSYAAYIGYKMDTSPISLLVTSDSVARAEEGAENAVFKGVTFHYDSFNDLKVITWEDRGLTYALVSDLEERGQQSCVVCHEGTHDHDIIEGLKPGK
jgi:anti-sigma factor RsiW